MKKKLFFSLSLLLFTFSVASAEEEGVHRFATFNVRYVNAKNGDTGDKYWGNRRWYVVQIIKDYDFDIVGTQEVTGNNKDEVTQTSQLQDLQDSLTAYDCIAYERSNKDYSYNAIFYKKDKYECLNHCSFFLSPNPWKEFSCALWEGGDIARRCIVAHMRVRATGEEFFFCDTHCNYAPDEAGIRGAEVIRTELPPLIGNLPTVLVGDFNMDRGSHELSYRAYASLFEEARVTAPIRRALPEDGPNVDFTNNFHWNIVYEGMSGTSEYDHQFYRGMEALSYHPITEHYGRSVMPSDHLPVLVRYRLLPFAQIRHTHPVKDEASLNAALDTAAIGDTILIETDVLTLSKPLVLSRSVCLIGQPDKTSIVLNGNQDAPVISVPHYSALELLNIAINNHSLSTNLEGGSAVMIKGFSLKMKNCTFNNCVSKGLGGAIYARTEVLEIDSCSFSSDSASVGGAVYAQVYGDAVCRHNSFINCKASKGGGIYLDDSQNIKISHSEFIDNSATSGAAINLANYKTALVSTSNFIGNTATQQGTLSFAPITQGIASNVFHCVFLNNSLNAKSGLAAQVKKCGGAAVYIKTPIPTGNVLNMGFCTMINNTSSFSSADATNFRGGAVTVLGAQVSLMGNLMMANPLFVKEAELKYADLIIDETNTKIVSNVNNLYSDDPKVNGWKSNIASSIRGSLTGGVFTPQVTEDNRYELTDTYLGTFNFKCLGKTQRLCESLFAIDLNEDGSVGGVLEEDAAGQPRDTKSCIGALEYLAPSDLFPIEESNMSRPMKQLINNQVIIAKDNRKYTLLGTLIQ
ncbi:MAG: endonuclease/exonuclease/phosphatase family protein [Paludibacteraceae bacterium]|nr:endonuclease/exonuclease/phosphatase family protein [Paludibacteraceae bacterium]